MGPRLKAASNGVNRTGSMVPTVQAFWGGILRLETGAPMGQLQRLRDRFADHLPGSSQRQRALRVWAGAGLLMLLRPHWPLRLLPGWLVGLVLVWALLELLLWLWWPRRWR